MSVVFGNQDIKYVIKDKPVIGKLIRELIINENKELGEIYIVFTSNKRILEINQTFLNHNYFTDVISFSSAGKKKVSGEIYISVDQVRENSLQYGTGFSEETIRVIIHGVLHLLGYRDETKKEKMLMRDKEDHYLCKFRKIDL